MNIFLEIFQNFEDMFLYPLLDGSFDRWIDRSGILIFLQTYSVYSTNLTFSTSICYPVNSLKSKYALAFMLSFSKDFLSFLYYQDLIITMQLIKQKKFRLYFADQTIFIYFQYIKNIFLPKFGKFPVSSLS